MSALEVPKKWDHESDVIIVGGGTAGLPAAIAVAEAGLKATVLETRQVSGGSCRMVVGGIAFAGSDEEKAAGIDDSPEIFYDDMVNVCGATPELARAYVNNHLDIYKIFKEEGMVWPGLISTPLHSRLRGIGWLFGLGPKMVQILEDRAKRKGAEILFKHRATRLIPDPKTGKIIGLKVDVGGETKNFKAKRGVIIATGGFGHNREMIAEFSPTMVNAVPKMPPSHMGDGLKMGLAVGAATKDIGIAVAPSWCVCAETHSPAIFPVNFGGIMVNVNGKRFYDESCKESYYGPMTGAGMQQPGGVYWVIFNDKIMDAVGTEAFALTEQRNEQHIKETEKCKQYRAETLEEMAKILGIDAKGLKETVDKYNSDIDNPGYDTVFGRKAQMGENGPLVKITPPFRAIKCVTCTTSMKGGLKINGKGQVLNQFDEVIPGLYAAGEVTGGLHTKTYLLSVMTSASMTQGLVAGRNAVKEPVS